MESSLALAYDLGGTKLAVGVVDKDGRMLAYDKRPIEVSRGLDAVLDQIQSTADQFRSQFPQIDRAGIASAGPLDPFSGLLLDPTNFITEGKSWGAVPLVEKAQERLGLPVKLENDAAAAVLAEYWVGEASRTQNMMVVTLGTGVGVGVMTNGQLLRSGRQLHPEASHIPLNYTDETAPCGCGLYGCIEAYVSGRNFTARMAKEWNEPGLTGETLVKKARENDKKALEAFDRYAHWMAMSLNAFVVLFSPEVIVLAGGFAEASDLFLPQTQPLLEKFLERRRVGVDLLPRVCTSSLKNELGILGAAHVAFHR